MPKVVLGHGPKDAKICLIGEAPGEREVLEGRPFVGSSGKKLDSLLIQAGIKREECYLDNVMQVRPPGNNFGHFYDGNEPKPELIEGQQRLYKTLGEIKPNVICLLGNEPLKAITGKSKITKWRGSILPTHLGKIIPAIHPAAVLRNYEWSPLLLFDLKRVKQEAETPVFQPAYQPADLHVVRTASDALFELQEAQRADYLTIDLETVSRDKFYITHFGFASGPNHAVSIPFCSIHGVPKWSLTEEVSIWEAIARLCLSDSRKIFQNAVFDIPILNEKGFVIRNFWMDTMIAHSAVYPEIPKGLDTLTSIYTRIPYYYGLKEGGADDFARYNALDCLSTHRVALKLKELLHSFGTAELYYTVLHPVTRPAISMATKGLKCDFVWREQEAAQLRAKGEELQEELNGLVGEELNPNSTKQVPHYLYDVKKLKPVISRKTRRRTCDEEALLSLYKKSHLPEIFLIIKLRSLSKTLGTYYDSCPDKDGRMRCSWNIAGAVTGRWSSSVTLLDTGMNLQNVPTIDRRMFIADEGMVFVYGDLKQAEARIVAWLADDPMMKSIFQEGKDIHRINTHQALKIPLEEVTPEQRYAGKTLGHAANYRIGPRKFASEVETELIGKALKAEMRGKKAPKGILFTTAEAKVALQNYYGYYLKLPLWHSRTINEVSKKRILTTSMGRRRTFFGRMNDETFRQAINYRPQSTVADIINKALCRLELALPEGSDLLLQTHDAIMLQCPEGERDNICRILVRAMTETILEDLTIPVEVKVGANWAEMEDWVDPLKSGETQ